jgi:predicted enzyme related to lactoylglutathione lyase
MSDPKAKGRFVWFDLNTSDPDGAIEFYSDVVGWGTSQWSDAPPGMPPYTMWQNGEAPIGGVGRIDAGMAAAGVPPHWAGYVGVPDVDATVEQATKLGGSVVVPPTDIPTVGRFAFINDPQGAMIGVFTAAGDAPGHEGDPQPGDFSWHELATTDYEKAFDFYSALFGWEKGDAMDMGPAGTYQLYTRNGRQLGGMYNKTDDMPFPPSWSYYAMVRDIEGAVEKIKAGGGDVMVGPMEVPGGDQIVMGKDPQGAMFALHARKA